MGLSAMGAGLNPVLGVILNCFIDYTGRDPCTRLSTKIQGTAEVYSLIPERSDITQTGQSVIS